MFNRFKKFISLMLCAAIFNACVLPSADLLAVKHPVKKQQLRTNKPHHDKKTNSAPAATDTEEKKEPTNPTMQDTWQKVKNFEFKSLTRDDYWNIGKTVVGAASAVAVAYLLFRSKDVAGDNHGNNGNGSQPDMPGDNLIPKIPSALQDIKDDQYGSGYEQKIKDLCNRENRKKLHVLKLDDPLNQLKKEIGQIDPTSEDKTPLTIEEKKQIKKQLIDRYHNELQNHLQKQALENPSSNTDSNKGQKTTEEPKKEEPKKPVVLYPYALQTTRQNVPVARQSGASCGYHAVLNSIISIQDIDEHQANELINAHFAQADGTWRAPMIQNRKKALVKNYIERLIHKCMLPNTQEEQIAWNTTKATWNVKITGDLGWFYRLFNAPPQKPLRTLNAHERRALNRIAIAYAHAFVLNENLNLLKENPADLETQLQEIIRQERPHITQEEIDNISHCIRNIDLTELPLEIAHANTLVHTALNYAYETNRKSANDPWKTDLETDLYGDNLNTVEMENLKALASRQYSVDLDAITIIDNTNLLNTQAYQGILTTAKEQKIENDCRHAFCIRTSRNNDYDEHEVEQLMKVINDVNATQEAKDKAESRLNTITEQLHADTGVTHWIEVTLNRNNAQNIYQVKDSMCSDYTNHPNVLQLIEALERPDIPEPVATHAQPGNNDSTINAPTNSSH